MADTPSDKKPPSEAGKPIMADTPFDENPPSEAGKPFVSDLSSEIGAPPTPQRARTKLSLERLFGRRFAEWFRNVGRLWKVVGGVVAVSASLVAFADFLGKRVAGASTVYAFKERWHDLGRDKIVEIHSDVKKPRYIFSLARLSDDRLVTRDHAEESIYDLKVLYFWDKYEKGSYYKWGEILTWIEEAAKQGYVEAQNTLGVLYWNGWAVEKDKSIALQWWGKAADQGSKYAQHNLAVYHWEHKNQEKSLKFWKKAANQGLEAAKYNLANIHWDKARVLNKNPQEFEKAINLYEEARNQGHRKSYFYLWRAYILKEEIEIFNLESFDKKRFVNYWESIVESTDGRKIDRIFKILVSYNLGVIYAKGLGVKRKNLRKSKKWFVKSLNYFYYGNRYLNKYSHVNFMIGNAYLKAPRKIISRLADWVNLLDLLEYFGYKERLYTNAENAYKRASDKNYAPAQYALAFFYWEGKNGRKNLEEAERLLKAAAKPKPESDSNQNSHKNKGYCLAQHALGLIYWWGEGEDEKRDEAYELFKKAADQGLAESHYYLARYHYDKFNELDESEADENKPDDNKPEKNAQGHLEKSYMYYIVSNNLEYEKKHTEKQGTRVKKILEKKMLAKGEATKSIPKIKEDGETLANTIKKMKIENCSLLES